MAVDAPAPPAGPAGGAATDPVAEEAERRARKREKKRKREALREELARVQREREAAAAELNQKQAAAAAAAQITAQAQAAAAVGGARGGRAGGKARVGGRGRAGAARGTPAKGGASPMGKAARKAKICKDRAKRMQALWGQCATVVKQVKVNKYSWPFHKPVDWKALNLPDYPTIVKTPMDLQTVTDKLGGVDAKGDRTYQTPLEMRDDMRMIFDNCRLYNQPGQDVRIMGDMLSDHFEKRWQNSNIEGKWLMECEIQKYEDEELAQIEAGKWGRSAGGEAAGGTPPAAAAAPAPVSYAQPADAAPVSAPAPAAAEPKPAPAAPAAAVPAAAVAGSSGRGAMPFEQKRKLSVALGMLPPEKLVQVVEIVKRRATISGADDGNDEIELDMETLDSETLWELDDYVNQCKKKKVPPRTPWRPVALPRPRPRRGEGPPCTPRPSPAPPPPPTPRSDPAVPRVYDPRDPGPVGRQRGLTRRRRALSLGGEAHTG